jgi:chromosome segregation ATPase
MDIKRLYEEQESQYRQRMLEKEEEIDTLRHDLEYRNRMLTERTATFQQKDEEIARLRGDGERLRAEAQAKIAQLQDRIKELNQKLMGASGPAGAPRK